MITPYSGEIRGCGLWALFAPSLIPPSTICIEEDSSSRFARMLPIIPNSDAFPMLVLSPSLFLSPWYELRTIILLRRNRIFIFIATAGCRDKKQLVDRNPHFPLSFDCNNSLGCSSISSTLGVESLITPLPIPPTLLIAIKYHNSHHHDIDSFPPAWCCCCGCITLYACTMNVALIHPNRNSHKK